MDKDEKTHKVVEALERARRIQENRLRIIATKTIVEGGRIRTKYLIENPELGRGKCFWI